MLGRIETSMIRDVDLIVCQADVVHQISFPSHQEAARPMHIRLPERRPVSTIDRVTEAQRGSVNPSTKANNPTALSTSTTAASTRPTGTKSQVLVA
jgi:hypothetical protein